MSYIGHIVDAYNKTTKGWEDGTKTSRSPKQAHERPPRPRDPSVLEVQPHAWIPDHRQYTQEFRRLLRTKHHIPPPGQPRRKRIHQKPVGPKKRPTEKSLQPNARGNERTELYRRIFEPHLQEATNDWNGPPMVEQWHSERANLPNC